MSNATIIEGCKCKAQAIPIKQGEAMGLHTNIRPDKDSPYIPSFEGWGFKALVSNGADRRIFSTADGTITVGVEVIDDTQRGYIEFGLTGNETKNLTPGLYDLSIARVFDSGDAIGIAEGAIEIIYSELGSL